MSFYVIPLFLIDPSLNSMRRALNASQKMIYLPPEYFSEIGQIEKTETQLLTDVTQINSGKTQTEGHSLDYVTAKPSFQSQLCHQLNTP